ncbi:hypothetical protein M431DRAFT_97524 [Trichoderma harzianum CBS 226.95]|uniref:Ricin B lectin domain-containing protein n=1 Tax=Trichoderma harzianum CBS 226.95 TaxID=983964 RepID=A0A2T3ZXB0_TRIHA|nr:hypothetical protein M431DRAFT_97524 [Trichoderma harzianum CBS 226.95]PTB49450.1 hypothetical protein M431DRAFT_97524 [Trichoderma harzianum CBS 226.95]
MISKTTFAVLFAALAAAGPIQFREVASLDPAATAEAHPRDDTATRAFSNVQIKTSDGKCLSVDPLSGDFRANLTPIQITDCGSNDAQGWDVITSGVHNDQKGEALIVSTKTQACFNFDPRRAAGNQVLLFSCGGRADGSGQVTNSQLFAFTGGNGPLSFAPGNDPTKCFAAKGNVIDIADCNANDATQKFTFGGAAAGGSGNDSNNSSAAASSAAATSEAAASSTSAAAAAATTSASAAATSDAVVVNPGDGSSQTTAAPPPPVITGNPTTPVPVSGAGGTLNPSAVAEAQAFDASAVRPLESVNIRAADGRCFFVNPTAGDFRENLIPVGLATCSEDASQKFDVVTKGVHDDAQAGEALLVSVLTNGCINFDGRRAANDQVIMFSCGGRADGSGKTATSQLFPFKAGDNNIVLTPASATNTTCLVAGADRVESAQCSGQKDQTFELVEIL